MIRPEFVRRKLHLIAEDLLHLTAFADESFEAVTSDPLKLAAVERLLERIVTRAIDINQHLIAAIDDGTRRSTRITYRDTFLRLAELDIYPADFAQRISRSAGLRNILVHEYNDIDQRVTYTAIRSCLVDYRAYISFVSDYLDRIET